MRHPLIAIALLIAIFPAAAQQPGPSYNNSLLIAPLYIEYTKVSEDKFAAHVQELSQLSQQGANWAVLEYNPSQPVRAGLPSSNDLDYYSEQLNLLYAYRPHVIVPFAWTELPEQSQYAIRGKPFERALAGFIKKIGDNEWSPAKPPAKK